MRVGFISFGIRALALDSRKDHEKRRQEREERFERRMEESRKEMLEIFQEHAKLEAIEKEKVRKEQEKREKEEKLFREKEREQEKEEKEMKAILISNNYPSSFEDFILQELKDESPKEVPFESPCSKRKSVAIIPSAHLLIQPNFGSQIHISDEEKAKDCVVENTYANQKLFADDLFLCKKKKIHGFFERNFFDLKLNLISSPFEEHTCFKRKIHALIAGICSQGKNATSMNLEQIKLDFQRIVFDPGG